jgi:tetratricopeptide (TPR) repeat protein
MAHDHEMYMTLTEAALELRDSAALQKYIPQLEMLAGRDQHPLYLAIARRARGAAHRLEGEHAKAEAALKEALASFEELGARWQVGRTHFELGEAAQARSKKTRAREHFTQALAAFEELGARPEAERTRARLKPLN